MKSKKPKSGMPGKAEPVLGTPMRKGKLTGANPGPMRGKPAMAGKHRGGGKAGRKRGEGDAAMLKRMRVPM